MNQFQQYPVPFTLSTSIKIVIGGDCYRMSKFPQSYADLEETVRVKFEGKLPDNFCFKYEDSDNDSINIESQSDFEALQEYCQQDQLKSIKLRIDSKFFKQYYNWQQQLQQVTTSQLPQQQIGSFLSPQPQPWQINNALGAIMNPFSTNYQNLIPRINIPKGSGVNNLQNLSQSLGGMETSQNQLFQLVMLLSSQSAFGNQRTGSNPSGMGGGNANNTGNTSHQINFNSNTNAVNQSLSSQAQMPILSKHTSEVNNANENVNSTFNNAKRFGSANQSQSDQHPMLQQPFQMSRVTDISVEGNISFTNGKVDNNNILGGNAFQCFNPVATKLNGKGTATTQPTSSTQAQNLNLTSKFFNPDQQGYYASLPINLDALKNPMDLDHSSPTSPSAAKIDVRNALNTLDFKRTDSESSDKQQQLKIPTQQASNSKMDAFNSKLSELSTSNLSSNIDNRHLSTTACTPNEENRSQRTANNNISQSQTSNMFGQSPNISAIFSGQGRGGTGFRYDEMTENTADNANLFMKRELSPSPSQSQPNTFTNWSSTLAQGRPQNGRFSLVGPQRLSSITRIPCEKCMQAQKNQMDTVEQSLTVNPPNLKNQTSEIVSSTQVPLECDACYGTGFVKTENYHLHHVILSILRSKLKDAEMVLKGVTIRQQKIEKIIPKQIMECLQHMLQQKSGDEERARETDQPSIGDFHQNIFDVFTCFECKSLVNCCKFAYLCVDCKSHTPDQDQIPQTFGLKYLFCENCEEHHDSTHRLVQLNKEDIMTLSQPQQRLSNNLERSVRFSQPVNGSSLQNSSTHFAASSATFSPFLQLEGGHAGLINRETRRTNTFTKNTFLQPYSNQVQEQYDLGSLPPNQRTRSRHEYKSATVIISPAPSSNEEQILENPLFKQEDAFIENGRFSTNQNIFKPNNSLHITNQISSVTAKFVSDEEQATLQDSQQFIRLDESTKRQAFELNSPRDSATPRDSSVGLLPNQFQKDTDFVLAPVISHDSLSITHKESMNKMGGGQELQSVQFLSHPGEPTKNTQETFQSFQISTHINNITGSSDSNPQPNKSATTGQGSCNSTSICVKSIYNASSGSCGGTKLSQSFTFTQNRNSLTQSIAQSSQYRAKLVYSFCSSELLNDDSIIVFQEILNNGSDNWPENVFLKCISGITDNNQYPVIQVNKGEMMSIAFPIKIEDKNIPQGEQVKTAWRLYYQQQNEERKFFGPKITIEFTYKKAENISEENTPHDQKGGMQNNFIDIFITESLEIIMRTALSMMKSIFSKDDQAVITDFVQKNGNFAEQYLLEKPEERSISTLIIKFIEHYVPFRNSRVEEKPCE